MKKQLLSTLLLGTVLALAGCGGGGGDGGTGSTGAGGSVVSQGVMVKGSVIVNGVHYDDSTATVRIDDNPSTRDLLQNGMIVKVRGSVNDDGINGIAQQVQARAEVRGSVTSVNAGAQSFVVLGQTVLVGDDTILNDLTAPIGNSLVGVLVEVHGLRNTAGQILATRIEANPGLMGDNTVDEIRGVVSGGANGANPPTFLLGAQQVNAAGALVLPANASYQNGSVIEAHCTARPCVANGVFQVSRIEVEDANDSAFRPSSGQRFEAEGLISGFNGHPGTFFVAGTSVTTTGSTRFEGGIADDLKNDIKVEAEGSWNGSTLVARKIEFKRSVIRLQGLVTASNSGAGTFTMNVAGRSINIETDSFTDGAVPSVSAGSINSGNCVQVRGQRKASVAVVVTAGEISVGNCSNSSRPVIQAPVEFESPETSIRLLGFDIDVSNPSDNPPYEGLSSQALTRSQFFDAVTPAGNNAAGVSVAGTLVKVTFNENNNSVRQAELED